MTPQNITSSFRTTGVLSVNCLALEILQGKEKCLPKLSMADITKSNGIFCPFTVPARSTQPIDK